MDGSTHACKTEQCGGGVGRNMAEALWRMRDGRAKLLTAIGDDADGDYLTNIAPGLLLDGCVIENAKTSMYAAIFDAKGECLLGVGDMNIHEHITTDLVDKHMKYLVNAPMVVIDGNVPLKTVDHVLRLCKQFKKSVFFEPTDRRKASKALSNKHQFSYSSPNVTELRAMANFIKPNCAVDTSAHFNEIVELCKIITQYIQLLIVTFGSKGVITARRINHNKNNYLIVRLYPVAALLDVENVSGAGDCFSSGFIHGMLLELEESQCVSMGFEAARQALLCKQTVPREFILNSTTNTAHFNTWKYAIN